MSVQSVHHPSSLGLCFVDEDGFHRASRPAQAQPRFGILRRSRSDPRSSVPVEGELGEPLRRTQLSLTVKRPSFLMIQVDLLSPGTLLAGARLQYSSVKVQVEPVLLALGGHQGAWIGPFKSPPSGVAPKQVIRTSCLPTQSFLDL